MDRSQHIEILNEETFKPVDEGEPGLLVMTPMFSNNGAAFLRWNSGDIVTWKRNGETSSGLVSFLLSATHTARPAFSKFEVNINHQEYEDFIFDIPEVNDFKAELVTASDGTDAFLLSIELRPGSDTSVVTQNVIDKTKRVFEVTADVHVMQIGTLAKEFESSVKAPRFADLRK